MNKEKDSLLAFIFNALIFAKNFLIYYILHTQKPNPIIWL